MTIASWEEVEKAGRPEIWREVAEELLSMRHTNVRLATLEGAFTGVALGLVVGDALLDPRMDLHAVSVLGCHGEAIVCQYPERAHAVV